MKIKKQIVEFTLLINGREEEGWFDGHVFTLKGVKADQIERMGAALEREFASTGGGTRAVEALDRMIEKAGEIADRHDRTREERARHPRGRYESLGGRITISDAEALRLAPIGATVTLEDGRRIDIQPDGSALERREAIAGVSEDKNLYLVREEQEACAKQEAERLVEKDARADREAKRRQEEIDQAQRAEADAHIEASLAARRKADAARAEEQGARAAREADRRRQETEDRERIERQNRRHEEAEALRAADEADAQIAKQKAEAEEQARAIAEGQRKTAKLLAEQTARDKAAAEKAALDANLAAAVERDAERKRREEAEKPAGKPDLRIVPPPPASKPEGDQIAPNGKPVPPPPAELLLPTARLGAVVRAAHGFGFRTLDDLEFALFTVWMSDVPLLRALAGTAAEKRARIEHVCMMGKLTLEGPGAQTEEDAGDE